MQRVVIDTNVYIDWLNEGRHEAVLFQRDLVKHLSAVGRVRSRRAIES